MRKKLLKIKFGPKMASQIVKRGIQTASANLANTGTAASAGHSGMLSKNIKL